jgi:hypothetical protein
VVVGGHEARAARWRLLPPALSVALLSAPKLQQPTASCVPCWPGLQLAQQLGSNPALAPRGAAADGADSEQAEWRGFLADLRAFAALERPWTLELTDPLDSSLVAAPGGEPPAVDARWATTTGCAE